ncbi:hypothetical protein [Lactobacillus sp. Sy-1]|uniref:hypothetical protein n=1 Tax=Lactobacillus sp. Sy-1 TaxID=2109645 RepID=UPI001C5B5C16|nr:hypothetical protein [Lactobacillus sp. Sy-1]MBW1606378.1 hypothetical protein [Lactobacillus sp. Sy-1]
MLSEITKNNIKGINMNSILFKDHQFDFDSDINQSVVNDDCLVFFNNDVEVLIYISIEDGQLILRPRNGVSFQKTGTRKYQIIKNR